MSAAKPPPLPGGESAAASYVRFALAVVPAATFLLFAKTFLYPKVLALWEDAGLKGGKVQWLIDSTELICVALAPLVGLVILGSVAMELQERTWRWMRSWALVLAGTSLNLLVLVAITLMAISAYLAAPIVAYKGTAKDPRVQPAEKAP